MKRAAKLGGNAMTGIIGRQIVEGAAGLTHAIKYCRAAQKEEKNGFAYTAAVEWQKAAEFLSPFPSLADRCWQQWERIMRLPRRLAGPISDAPAPGSAQFRAADNSDIEQVLARVAEELFPANDVAPAASTVLTIAPAQMEAAAA